VVAARFRAATGAAGPGACRGGGWGGEGGEGGGGRQVRAVRAVATQGAGGRHQRGEEGDGGISMGSGLLVNAGRGKPSPVVHRPPA
jgi:hypothetical protein